MGEENPNSFWTITEEFTVGEVVVAVSRSKDQYPRYSMRVGVRRGPWFPVELLTTDHLPAITEAVARAQDWIHAEQAVHQRRIDKAAGDRDGKDGSTECRGQGTSGSQRSSTLRIRRSGRRRTRRAPGIGADNQGQDLTTP